MDYLIKACMLMLSVCGVLFKACMNVQVEVEYAQHKSVSAPRLQQAELQMPPKESDYETPVSNAPLLPPRDRNSADSASAHSRLVYHRALYNNNTETCDV